MLKKSCWILVGISLLAGATAVAASLPAPLEAAIADVETRRAAAERLRFTFTVHTVTKDKEFRLRFDPEADKSWTLLSPADEDTAKLKERMDKRAAEQEEGPDRELLAGELRELFGGRIELVEANEAERVYRFDLSEEAEIGGGGGRFDAHEHLKGEIAIGPGDRLLWLRFFAEKSFKPAIVASIKTFDLKLFFDPIWPDGPYVLVRQSMDLDGSAFFKSFGENMKTRYADFEAR